MPNHGDVPPYTLAEADQDYEVENGDDVIDDDESSAAEVSSYNDDADFIDDTSEVENAASFASFNSGDLEDRRMEAAFWRANRGPSPEPERFSPAGEEDPSAYDEPIMEDCEEGLDADFMDEMWHEAADTAESDDFIGDMGRPRKPYNPARDESRTAAYAGFRDRAHARQYAATPDVQDVLRAYQQIGSPARFAGAREFLRDGLKHGAPATIPEALQQWPCHYDSENLNAVDFSNQDRCHGFLLHWMVHESGGFFLLTDDEKTARFSAYRDQSEKQYELKLPPALKGADIKHQPKWQHDWDYAAEAEQYNRAYNFIRCYALFVPPGRARTPDSDGSPETRTVYTEERKDDSDGNLRASEFWTDPNVFDAVDVRDAAPGWMKRAPHYVEERNAADDLYASQGALPTGEESEAAHNTSDSSVDDAEGRRPSPERTETATRKRPWVTESNATHGATDSSKKPRLSAGS